MSGERRDHYLGIESELPIADPVAHAQRIQEVMQQFQREAEERQRLKGLPTEDLLRMWETRDQLPAATCLALVNELSARGAFDNGEGPAETD